MSRETDWPEYTEWYDDCWCGMLHQNPLTDLGHLVIAELRIPNFVEWLAKRLGGSDRR